ncbi:MAG: hypothetical protein JRN15_16485, partial [Nitrososphaerota archaeon]|nr:hypothetical protein [Nitrososphaerota archaeon]
LAAVQLSNRDGEGAPPTHIMYRSNLSWTVCLNAVRKLEQYSLITRQIGANGRPRFFLTPKGMEELERYRLLSRAVLFGDYCEQNLVVAVN